MQSRVIIAIAAVVVIGIGAGLWWWQSTHTTPKVAAVSTPEPSAEPRTVEEGETPATPAVQRRELPPLDASDDYVREQLSVTSPEMAEWLKQDDLVRRFAV